MKNEDTGGFAAGSGRDFLLSVTPLIHDMDRRVRQVLEILRAEWRRAWRIEDLAEQVGLRPSRLAHLFRANAQTTIRDYVRERRLVAAAERIASTCERISVISYDVGFQDVSNFNHAFKKRFGMSPRQYRDAQDARLYSN